MNTLAQYIVPQWISIFFLIAIPLPFILITLFVRNVTAKSADKSVLKFVVAFFILYLGYITFACFNGWFNEVFFPPKVLLYTTFPYGFLLFGIVLHTKPYKTILENASLESLIKLHIFRVIGVFFILLAVHDALPKPFAFIAGAGDVLTAITSIFVVKAIQNKKKYARTLTYCWNLFGAIDILFTAIAANVLTKISINTGSMGVDTLAVFPFCIIPAFAPPTILFLHWAIFQKMKKK
ncbi:MAG: hypothetical protein ACRCYO_02960 [Bacteroidia bacterium]